MTKYVAVAVGILFGVLLIVYFVAPLCRAALQS